MLDTPPCAQYRAAGHSDCLAITTKICLRKDDSLYPSLVAPQSNRFKDCEQNGCCACGTWRLREGEAPWEKHRGSEAYLLQRPPV